MTPVVFQKVRHNFI